MRHVYGNNFTQVLAIACYRELWKLQILSGLRMGSKLNMKFILIPLPVDGMVTVQQLDQMVLNFPQHPL